MVSVLKWEANAFSRGKWKPLEIMGWSTVRISTLSGSTTVMKSLINSALVVSELKVTLDTLTFGVELVSVANVASADATLRRMCCRSQAAA